MNLLTLFLGILAAISWIVAVFFVSTLSLFVTGGPLIIYSPLLGSTFNWIVNTVAFIPAILIVITTVRLAHKRK